MNETKNDQRESRDGDPLIDRGIADSARGSVTEPDEEDVEHEDDGEDEEEEGDENVDL